MPAAASTLHETSRTPRAAAGWLLENPVVRVRVRVGVRVRVRVSVKAATIRVKSSAPLDRSLCAI